MQRLIIVHNPRSSMSLKIRQEVIEPLQKLSGYQVGKFEVLKTSVEENVQRLMRILQDGDLIVVTGGDGTATVALNAAMTSGRDVTLGVLGYGNFNDFARCLGERNALDLVSDYESGSVQRIFPLEALFDGKHYRYAACYFTIGMFAESTEVFETEKIRENLKKSDFKSDFSRMFFSIKTLVGWYFQNRKKNFLPKDIQLDDVPMNRMKTARSGRVNIVKTPIKKQISDVMFVNGRTVAKMMKGGDFWNNPNEFLISFGRLKSFWRLMRFMIQSIFVRLPGKMARAKTIDEEDLDAADGSVVLGVADVPAMAKIDFSGPEEFEIQAEGEYMRVKAKELVVKKAETSVKVVCK